MLPEPGLLPPDKEGKEAGKKNPLGWLFNASSLGYTLIQGAGFIQETPPTRMVQKDQSSAGGGSAGVTA